MKSEPRTAFKVLHLFTIAPLKKKKAKGTEGGLCQCLKQSTYLQAESIHVYFFILTFKT